MNSAEELCHSSGPWKKHKYFQKIGEGANAVYKYAKKTASDTTGKLTGDYYESEANRLNKDADYYNHEANRHFDLAVKDAAKKRTPEEEKQYEQYWRAHKNMMNANFSRESVARTAARKASRKAENAPLKKINRSVERGQKIIDDLFHPKTTVSVTSNLMPAGTKKTIKK